MRRSRAHRPASVTEAIKRVNDLACVCGTCGSIRPKLEKKIGEISNPNSDLTVDLADLLKMEIRCPKTGVAVSPLELSCHVWRPPRNPRPISVAFGWSQSQKFS